MREVFEMSEQLTKVEDLVSLQPRKKPTQKRSRERVDSILDACAQLLDEVGPDGVNTNTIAERAHIPVSSLYQYFPNKHAVLLDLMGRILQEIDQAGTELLDDFRPDTEWREISDRSIQVYADICERLPGCTPLWHTLKAHPELYQISTERLVGEMKTLQRLLKAYCQIHLPDRHSEAEIEFMLYITIDAIMPILGTATRRQGMEKEQHVEAAKQIARGYLGFYLDK